MPEDVPSSMTRRGVDLPDEAGVEGSTRPDGVDLPEVGGVVGSRTHDGVDLPDETGVEVGVGLFFLG